MPFTQTGCAPIRQKPLPAVLLDSLSQRDVRAACAPRILACASEEPLPTGRRPQARNMDKSAGSCRSPPAPRPPRRGRSGPDGPWRPCIGRTALPISVAAAAVKRADGGRLAGRCGCHGRPPPRPSPAPSAPPCSCFISRSALPVEQWPGTLGRCIDRGAKIVPRLCGAPSLALGAARAPPPPLPERAPIGT